MKEFDLESLSTFDGKNGRPCFIAHGDKVIDVSASKLENRNSPKRHQAGTDLTSDIFSAPLTGQRCWTNIRRSGY